VKKRLLLLSFVEGATVMAVELCGARLLAPVFGSSLYVWAAVLGITLVALAFGYFTGGWWSKQAKSAQKKLFTILSLASLTVILMPFIAEYLVTRIAYFSFLPAMLISTTVLLFPPVFFLGASSPLFIFFLSNSHSDAGKVSGLVYAISTLVGILATFVCGFYLMPIVGLKLTLMTFGALLFLLNMVVLKMFSFWSLLLAIGLSFLNLNTIIKTKENIYLSEGVMGKVEVLDYIFDSRTIRQLKVNDIVQSEMDMATKKSVSEYVTVFDSLCKDLPNKANALVLGLGAGLTSNILNEKDFNVEAVEFDERMIYAAENFFALNKKVKVINDDARRFLNTNKQVYDLVLIDVFKAEEQPAHVVTIESLALLKKQMNKHAKLLINWHGYTTGKHGEGTAILYQTLKKQGFYVKLCSFSEDENYRNLIFVVSKVALPSLIFEVHPVIQKTNVVNTDDKLVLEEANALANLTWRNLYLRHYTAE